MLDNDNIVIPTNCQMYNFTYDGMNRLDNAVYSETDPMNLLISGKDNFFDENPAYNLNGNIIGLVREGNTVNSGFVKGTIDNLGFEYKPNSNQINKVNDSITSALGHDKHFINGSTSAYAYDANGNATFVPNKNSTITYNFLNLPSRVTIAGQNIDYLYDATGSKMKKTLGSQVSYYQGSVLKVDGQTMVLTGEGRMVYNTTSHLWEYEYDLKDHLGNTRISFSTDQDQLSLLQTKDYYPFGMEMANNHLNSPATKFLYNGKELQDECGLDWYDYGARFYDPMLARFHTIDALADTFSYQTPYAYAINNPVRYIDWMGMAPGDPFKSKVAAANDFGTYYNGTSIVKSTEFGSAIYKNSDGTYSYTTANIGANSQTYINENLPEGTTREGAIHSHGSEDPGYDNNNFSPGDKSAADALKQNEYVVTPSGELKEYDVKTKTVSVPEGASKNIPSDSNSGTQRVNTVTATDTKPKYIDPTTGKTHN